MVGDYMSSLAFRGQMRLFFRGAYIRASHMFQNSFFEG